MKAELVLASQPISFIKGPWKLISASVSPVSIIFSRAIVMKNHFQQKRKNISKLFSDPKVHFRQQFPKLQPKF